MKLFEYDGPLDAFTINDSKSAKRFDWDKGPEFNIVYRMKILGNRNVGHKSKFWSKIEILVKNLNKF